MCMGETGVLAEFSKDGALREGSAQPSLWLEGCPRPRFGGQ